MQFSQNHRTSQSQNIAVVIRIGNGDFKQGFPVTLRILEHGKTIEEIETDEGFCLPPAPQMRELYTKWQSQSHERSRRLQSRLGAIAEPQETNVSKEEQLESYKSLTDNLENYCQNWFITPEFGRLRDRILSTEAIRKDPSVPIIIRCDSNNQEQDLLSRLPYHLWDLYKKLENSEFALFSKYSRSLSRLQKPVKVLAIFGSSAGGLQLEKDAEALSLLEQNGAIVTIQTEPTNSQLSALMSQTWDILFFAGHSSSDPTGGTIQIREGETLSLKNFLDHDVAKGLKLAIFNSCDGLGIAEFLADLEIPNIIAMKEPVPDNIACLFLMEFLQEFTQGTQLCQAVRKARQRLRYEQEEFPGASWLPAVCLNPSASELVLPPQDVPTQDLPPQDLPPQVKKTNRLQLILGSVLAAGMLATAIPLIVSNRCQLLPSAFSSCKEIKSDSAAIATEFISSKKFISSGEKAIKDSIIQLSGSYSVLKKEGIKAFASEDYKSAKELFESLRDQAKRNKDHPDDDTRKAARDALTDPTVLIYRNNALVRIRHAENSNLPLHTIAVAAPLNVEEGKNIVMGVAQAQDVAVNRENQQDINLEIVIANDNNITEQAQEIATILAAKEQILAVIGHYTSVNTCAALKVYSPNNLVLVAPQSALFNLAAICNDTNKVFFRTIFSTDTEAKNLINYLINDLKISQPKVVAFYNSKDEYSVDIFDRFQQIRKNQVEVIAKYDLLDPKFTGGTLPRDVRKAINEANTIVMLPDGGSNNSTTIDKAIALTNNIAELKEAKEKPILASATIYLPKFIQQAENSLVERLYMTVDWHPQMCSANKFSRKVNQYWGGDSNLRTALSYESLQVLISTLKDSKTTRSDIHQELRYNEYSAPDSDVFEGRKISFDANGDRINDTNGGIITINKQLRFALAKDDSCPVN